MVGVSNNGFFYVAYLRHYGVTRQQASWPSSTHTIISHVIGLPIAALQSRFSVYRITLVGGIMSWMGFVLSAFSPSIEVVTLTMGVIYACGSGTTAILLSVYNAMYFTKYRGVATGSKFGGWSLSGLVFPYLLTMLFNTYGFEGGMLLTGAIVMHVMIFVMLLKRPPLIRFRCKRPRRKTSKQPLFLQRNNGPQYFFPTTPAVQDIHCLTEKPKPPDKVEEESSKPRSALLSSLHVMFKPLRSPVFYAFLPALVLGDYGDMMLTTIIVDYALDKGWKIDHAKSLIMCISLAGLVGRLLVPLAADKGFLSRSALAGLCFLVIALSLLGLPHVDSFGGVWLLCSTAAAPFGCMMTLKVVLVADYLGVDCLPSSMGVSGVAMLPLLLSNPAIVGYFRDYKGSYDNLFRLIAVLALLVATMLFGLVCYERGKREWRHTNGGPTLNGGYGATTKDSV